MKNLLIISFVFILVLLGFCACGKDKNEDICAGANFIFVNESGEDILSSLTQNHLDISEFKVIAEDSTNRLTFIEQTNDGNVVGIGVYGFKGMEGGNTFLKFGNITTDTIYAEFMEKGSSAFISHLYYNGKLIDNNSNVTECNDTVFVIEVKKE
jgi:hypothetical protein